MRTNRKPDVDSRMDRDVRLAGGTGAMSAKQGAEALLRRAVMTCLLWENVAYQSGNEIANQIESLVPQVDPSTVFDIAVEARHAQKLRHVPLFLAVVMSETGGRHRKLVSQLIPIIVNRPDELGELLSIYWRRGKKAIGKQIKLGLANAFGQFNEYQFGKWNRASDAVKVRDVMFLTHPKPQTQHQTELFRKIAEDTLETPDTWEVALSGGADKKEAWTRLITEGKLGALAFMRNLRNMENAEVDRSVIAEGFKKINPKWLLPSNYMKAYEASPRWASEIEDLMFRGYSTAPKLKGKTVFIVDVSGSMNAPISSKSSTSRMDVAVSMAIMAREVCEDVTIYATGGNDWAYTHKTGLVPSHRGFGLINPIKGMQHTLGGGGIFTRQCLEYIYEQERGEVDRIIIFSDSQDCDKPAKRVPRPFGKTNYIVDVSNNTHGVNYDGIWTAEISGWSENFIPFIFAMEGQAVDVEQ